MITKIEIINPNVVEAITWDLLNPITTRNGGGYTIGNVEGLNPPSTTVNVTDFSNIPGGSYVGSHSETRNITFDVYLTEATNYIANQKIRDFVMSVLEPGVPIQFRAYCSRNAITTNSTMYFATAYVESVDYSPFSTYTDNLILCSVSLICPDPVFYKSAVSVSALIDSTAYPAQIGFKRTLTVSKLVNSYPEIIPQIWAANRVNDMYYTIHRGDDESGEKLLSLYLNVPSGIVNMSITGSPTESTLTPYLEGYKIPYGVAMSDCTIATNGELEQRSSRWTLTRLPGPPKLGPLNVPGGQHITIICAYATILTSGFYTKTNIFADSKRGLA